MTYKQTATGKAMLAHGWPSVGRARVYTLAQLCKRYALAALLGAVMGAPAVVYIFCTC